jgi:myo-inositol-1(or 4)-monophosphatase
VDADIDLIRTAALDAGKVALRARERGLKVEYKSADNSPVTDGDLEVDRLLKDRLLGERPNYGWLSEETTDDPARLSQPALFVVDPIDGTRAYVEGKPWFTICIAVVRDGRPVASVVHAPDLGQMYEAVAGGGARCNGEAIGPSEAEALEDCAMVADARMFRPERWPRPWPKMRIESRSSIALRMALVASGGFDAALSLGSKADWDLAAADLIATEAGALATDHHGRLFRYNQPVPRQPSLVCAGPRVHALLIERLSHIEPVTPTP